MKRFAWMVSAVLGIVMSQGIAHAQSGTSSYGGTQSSWNIFNRKNKSLTPEEQRLNQFWHDYYDALKQYYNALDHIDWVAYYKNHGYQVPGGYNGPNGGPCNITYYPVQVTPCMQWAVPPSAAPMGGPPAGAYAGPPVGAYGRPGGY